MNDNIVKQTLMFCRSISSIKWISLIVGLSPVRKRLLSSMTAWQLNQYGLLDERNLVRCPTPRVLHPDDVLVKVHAASVNPIDAMMAGRIMIIWCMIFGLQSLFFMYSLSSCNYCLIMIKIFGYKLTCLSIKIMHRF